jgi:hypothetical protein
MNPKTKVFVNGKQIKWRNQYGSMSKWQIFKWNVKNFLRKVLRWTTIAGFTAGTVYIIFMAGGLLNPVMSYAVQEKIVSSDTLTGKIKELQASVVATVKSCESAGMKESDGIIILDTNNKMSIGMLQFQKLTVIYFYKNIYGKDITPKEAVQIALDEDMATQLASDIIFDTDKGLSNWLNCANKNNLAPKVAVIKELMK